MSPDDLILIIVDDHICEPADMFDAHVPESYRALAPKVVEQNGRHQWTYCGKPGRDLGLNAVAGKPREMFRQPRPPTASPGGRPAATESRPDRAVRPVGVPARFPACVPAGSPPASPPAGEPRC